MTEHPSGGTSGGPDGAGERGPAGQDRAEFGRLIEALRLVQDRITGAAPPGAVVAEAARTLEDLAAGLEPYTVPEREQVAGYLSELPGRGQALVPAFTEDEWDDKHAVGRFRLDRYYLGGNGAAHGGVLPLMFDEVLGRLANTGRSRSRTAFLHVNFRSITPVGPELRMEARFDREEGRKRFLSGALYHGDVLTADAEGLFVQLRPGQP